MAHWGAVAPETNKQKRLPVISSFSDPFATFILPYSMFHCSEQLKTTKAYRNLPEH